MTISMCLSCDRDLSLIRIAGRVFDSVGYRWCWRIRVLISVAIFIFWVQYMDYSSNAIEIIPEATGPEPWAQASNDQAIWATEDDYRSWNGEPSADTVSNPAYGDRQPHSQSWAGSEQPPSKKPRNSLEGNGSTSKSRAIGKMFFKTKLCCKFRAGMCPYITNCNFAHGMEELRKPPPNWQEIVALQEGMEPREEHQIPILTSSTLAGDGQRSYKGRHCKKFYTEEGAHKEIRVLFCMMSSRRLERVWQLVCRLQLEVVDMVVERMGRVRNLRIGRLGYVTSGR